MSEPRPTTYEHLREGAPRPSARTMRVTSLVRGPEVLERSAVAVRRLLQVTSAWGPETVLEVTHGRQGRARSTSTFTVAGAEPDGWRDDLRWALDGVARLGLTSAWAVAVPEHVAELVARRRLRGDGTSAWTREESRDPTEAELQRRHALRLGTPWPQPRYADLAQLLAFNVADRRSAIVVRHRICPATPLEEQMLREELIRSYDERGGTVHEYLGSVVRVRTFVGDARPLSGRVRAVLRQWGSELELVDLAPAERQRAWAGDPLGLAGSAVPEALAMALVRLPASGESGFPGYTSALAEVARRALDPVPRRPARAVRLGRARTTDGRAVAVSVDLPDLTQHLCVQGGSGTGKSTLLAALAVETLRAGGSFTLLDPPGTTARMLADQIPAELASGVRLVRHGSDDLNAPVNPLSGSRAELERMLSLYAEMLHRALDPRSEGMVGPRWKRWFTLIGLACAEYFGPDADLVTMMAIGSDLARVRELAKGISETAPDLAHRLMSEYGRLQGKEADDLTSWAVSKLQEILATERGRWVFGTGADGVDLAAHMAANQSVLIDLGARELGEPTARAIGAAHLLKVFGALGQRGPSSPLHLLLIDEAHLFSYGVLPKLLAEARKYHVGLVVATQHPGQLPEDLREALESNTGAFVTLRAGVQSAARASVRLDGWSAAELVRLPNLHAAAVISRAGVVTAPFTLEIDHRQRTERLARRGDVGSHVAAGIIARSRTAAAPYRGRSPMTDALLLERLRSVAPVGTAPSREARPAGRPLDEWIEQRRRLARSASNPSRDG